MARSNASSDSRRQSLLDSKSFGPNGRELLTVASAMAKHVNADIPGPIIQIGDIPVADVLASRGVSPSRFIFAGTSQSNQRSLSRLPEASAIEIDASQAVNELVNLSREIPEGVSAIVSSLKPEDYLSGSPSDKVSALSRITNMLHPQGVFIQISQGVAPFVSWSKVPNLAATRETVWLILETPSIWIFRDKNHKFADNNFFPLSSDETLSSEGFIDQHEPSAPATLPSAPPLLWKPPKPGRPPVSEAGRLIAFLDKVYGEYLPAHRDSLRGYILQHDPKLYKAIQSFERLNDLPPRLTMTTRNERLLSRLQQAAASGTLADLGKPGRRSVTGKLRRLSKRLP